MSSSMCSTYAVSITIKGCKLVNMGGYAGHFIRPHSLTLFKYKMADFAIMHVNHNLVFPLF